MSNIFLGLTALTSVCYDIFIKLLTSCYCKCRNYRVGQIKWHHFTFLLITN